MLATPHQRACYLILLLILPCSLLQAADKPALMLAKVFQSDRQITNYWISEKLDGVRARWNGQQLISRGGNPLNAPAWFTQGFPDTLLDGELWIARGAYQQTVSIIKTKKSQLGWKKVKFMLFDLPNHHGSFNERVAEMRKMMQHNNAPYLQMITQFQLPSNAGLMQHLDSMTEQGAEGLMLHHKAGIYQSGRSHHLLKLKKFTDAEAVVTGYRAGKGQFSGKMGAIQVKSKAGKVFFIGSGFSHQERDNPPALGSTVTFRYQGLTDRGIPRFAVFIRLRAEP